jgi:hypothetical protein
VAIAERCGKELIANETVWGARGDDTHVQVMRYTLAQLTQRGIGYTVHTPRHSLVADLHRDEWGPVGRPEWLHCIEPTAPSRGPRSVQRVRPAVGDGGRRRAPAFPGERGRAARETPLTRRPATRRSHPR